MLREGICLSRRHKRLLYAICGALWATGALWLLFHYFLRVPGEFGDTPHPLEPWWMRLHGFAAMLSLLMLGSLMRGHIRVGWNIGRNRLSGAVLVAAGVTLVATGWGLYYVSSEIARPVISIIHWMIGLSSAVAVAAHVYAAGRARRLARNQTPAAATRDEHRSRIVPSAAREATSS